MNQLLSGLGLCGLSACGITAAANWHPFLHSLAFFFQ